MANENLNDAKNEHDEKVTTDAASRMRDTAKWIVVGVFGTAGGVITGTTFSNAGQMSAVGEDAWRLWLGVGGLAVGFLGLAMLGRDALRVIALDIFSPNDLAIAKKKSFGLRSSLARLAGFDHRFDEQTDLGLQAVRKRLEASENFRWREPLTSYSRLLGLIMAADGAIVETPLKSKFLTIFTDSSGNLVARGGNGGSIELPSSKTIEIAAVDDGYVAFSRPSRIHYDIKDETVTFNADGEHSIERERLDQFDLESFRVAGFIKVEIAFEKLATWLYRNILMIAAGFILTAWAFNPPPRTEDAGWQVETTLPSGDTTVTSTNP